MAGLTGISKRNPLQSVFFILCTIVLGFYVLGPLVGLFAALPFYNGSMMELVEKIMSAALHPEVKLPVLILQGFATGIGLIVIPLLYLSSIERVRALEWFTVKPPLVILIVVPLLVLAFMLPNSIFIEWNANFSFPDFLKEFGTWARAREEAAAEITKLFTAFNSPGEFLLGLLVIALLPAVGEELVFRGMLQPEFFRASGNHHVAIWITAFIFSAFHMQFFGFVPRMFLGALFGYIYMWSGNFWLPVLAHFVNNAFMVTMLYLNQLQVITLDVESTEAAPWPMVLVFTVIFVVLVYYLYRYFKSKPAALQ
ncbi:MAG: CPBP family intramembrane metalloprotease [Cytophagales bacterium]|nr:CPBP family intramembrane metalloprotease [Cytophagales bacterium]